MLSVPLDTRTARGNHRTVACDAVDLKGRLMNLEVLLQSGRSAWIDETISLDPASPEVPDRLRTSSGSPSNSQLVP